MKTCLITGASGGIGSEIAQALGRQGYYVLLQGRNAEKLEKVRQCIGDNSQIVLGDLNDKNDRCNVLAHLSKYENIDLLVNAAGISQFTSFESMNETAMAEMITSNLVSPMLFIHAFIEFKNARASKNLVTIVNIGSAFGYIGYPGFSVYAASKFGLRGLTESLRREYADTRFQFAYFAPRATQTKINSSQVDDMNKALGNTVDSPAFVAQRFIVFLNKHSREATVGWPEKLFVKINGVLPNLVDNAIKAKLPVIKQHMDV